MPQSIKHRDLAYCYTAYIYRERRRLTHLSIKHRDPAHFYIEYIYIYIYISVCVYIEGRWTPSQLSTEILHTATLHIYIFIYIYIYIYIYIEREREREREKEREREQEREREREREREKGDGSPIQSSTEALQITTLHIYRKRWTPQSFKHRYCINHYSNCYIETPQSIEHGCLVYHYTAYI